MDPQISDDDPRVKVGRDILYEMVSGGLKRLAVDFSTKVQDIDVRKWADSVNPRCIPYIINHGAHSERHNKHAEVVRLMNSETPGGYVHDYPFPSRHAYEFLRDFRECKIEISHLMSEGGTSWIYFGWKDIHVSKNFGYADPKMEEKRGPCMEGTRIVVKLAKRPDEITSERAQVFLGDHPCTLKHEADVLGRISSRYVYSALNYGTFRGDEFLVLETGSEDEKDKPAIMNDLETYIGYWKDELTRDRSLHERFRRSDNNPEYERSRVHDLLLGLRDIHRAGLLHRDFKPSNVLVTQGYRFVTADLQTAVPFGSTGTYDGLSCGSVTYSSPETIQNAFERKNPRPLTPASDIFSAGLTISRVLNPLLDPSTFPSLEDRLVRSRFEDKKDAVVENVPDDYKRIISKCLDWDPERRYRSVDQLIDECSRVRRLWRFGQRVMRPFKATISVLAELLLYQN
jgi:serine/threonine protein kinase